MEAVILVIHLILALAIIGLVLLQRSEGGGLGIGGGGGGLGNVASAKSMNNVLTRATGLCAAAFFCTSLALGILAGKSSQVGKSIIDELDAPSAAITQDVAPTQDDIVIEIEDQEGAAAVSEPPTAPLAE